MIDFLDIVARLGAAAFIGGALGLNRWLHGKATGLRTMSLVALGPALVVLAAQTMEESFDADASSRIIQGIVTGVGFIGAGVIFRDFDGNRVRGMTTAASVWFVAALGLACGLGAWRVVLVSCALVALILWLGGRFENALNEWLTVKPGADEGGEAG